VKANEHENEIVELVNKIINKKIKILCEENYQNH
jgi:hypothetical protein